MARVPAQARDVAVAVLGLVAILCAKAVFARTSLALPLRGAGVRYATAGLECAAYVALGVVSSRHLRFLAPRGAALVDAALAVAVGALLVAGAVVGPSGPASPVVAVLACAAFAAGHVWCMLLFFLAAARIASRRSMATALLGGVALWQTALLGTARLTPGAASIACGALLVGSAVVLTRAADAPLRTIAGREPLRQLATTNPGAALVPTPTFYLAVFLMALAYSYANATVGIPHNGAPRLLATLALVALLGVALLRADRPEDRLFSAAVVLVMLGLLAVPLVTAAGGAFAVHTLFFFGSTTFNVLLWLLIYGLGRRNATAMAPLLGVIGAVDLLGGLCGSGVGAVASAAAARDAWWMQAVTLGVAAAFFAAVWLFLRSFSFSRAIQGIARVEMDRPGTGAPASDAGAATLADVCARIAREAELTPRETEVFLLLARGRNAGFIMSELHIKRNTVKAHTAHVYAKIGVHSQQELLTLVQGDAPVVATGVAGRAS